MKLLLISPSARGQQINLMLTPVDKLDLVVTSVTFGYNAQIFSGQLILLNDLLEDCGNGIKEVISDKMLDGPSVDASIYEVPSVRNRLIN